MVALPRHRFNNVLPGSRKPGVACYGSYGLARVTTSVRWYNTKDIKH